MCGIVGSVGSKDAVEVVLEGLRRLEYRGYDSAGVSFLNEEGQLNIFKKTGKIKNLVELLSDKKTTAQFAIGHTRWATHGKVNDTNSHPHNRESISLVHNGIIENADGLRNDLISNGEVFASETDSEVFISLVFNEMKLGHDFRTSVLNSFSKVEGHSAFVVLDEKSKQIIAIKSGAPLVCGYHTETKEAFISSDPYALAGMANKIYFPEDNTVCVLSMENEKTLMFFNTDGSISKDVVERDQQLSYDPTDKGDYEHYMLKEIFEQPHLIRSLAQYYIEGKGSHLLDCVKSITASRVHIVACGTAYYAGLVIKDYLEKFNKIPTAVDFASEFRYKNPLLKEDELGLFVSQSGETADTLAAQDLVKESKLKSLSIVNVDNSTLYRSCDYNLLIKAGVEVGVASTKAFTQQVLTGRIFSAVLAEELKEENQRKAFSEKFILLAQRIDEVLERSEEIKLIAEKIYNNKGFFFTGRGVYFPIALEGALKLKEIAYVHAEGYASGELKHGPIALIDEEMVNIAIVGPELFSKTISNIQEIKARHGIIVTMGPANNKDLEKVSDYYIPLNFEGLDELSPLYVNVVNQLLSYYMAKFKGTDIDKPRNLAKSVTVE